MNEPAISTGTQLPQRLDALLEGGCDPEAFLQLVETRSTATTESAWETLAQVDQLYRRGKLPATLYRAAKLRIERRALGFKEPVAMKVHAAVNDAPTVVAAPDAAELCVLRAELKAARALGAVYLERLADLEGRRAASAREAKVRPQSRSLFGVARVAIVAALAALLPTALTRSSGALRAAILAPPVLLATAAVARQVPSTLPGELSLTSDRYLVFPGAQSAAVDILRTGGSAGVVGLEYSIVSLGAQRGRDYVYQGRQTLTIGDGKYSAQIRVPILPNPLRKHTELFEVRVGNQKGGASLGEVVRATVFILPP